MAVWITSWTVGDGQSVAGDGLAVDHQFQVGFAHHAVGDDRGRFAPGARP